jgi:hypothetical protein
MALAFLSRIEEKANRCTKISAKMIFLFLELLRNGQRLLYLGWWRFCFTPSLPLPNFEKAVSIAPDTAFFLGSST